MKKATRMKLERLRTEETSAKKDNPITLSADNIESAFAITVDDIKKAGRILDDNKDGKISLKEIRRHRYTIMIATFFLASGSIVFNFSETISLIELHTKAVGGMIGSGFIGLFVGWLFSGERS